MHLVVLPGDGVGPEIAGAASRVLEAASQRWSLGLTLERHEIGLARLERDGTTFRPEVCDACRQAAGIVLGPISHATYPPPGQGGVNVSAALRVGLDLYANIRPSRTRRGVPHWGRTPMDLVIVRENTEGFYADRNMHVGTGELMPTPDIALAVRKVTAAASARIARAAFALARERRRKVTAVHKANVLRVSEGLFLDNTRRIAAEFPDVEYDEQLVDSMAALLVRDPARFDVIVTTNMFGDILSDEASELAGSVGLGASLNVGARHGVAQAQHGSAPDIAGRDVANPAALILSAAMLLEWLGREHARPSCVSASRAIVDAVDTLLASPATRTPDVGGTCGTRTFTSALVDEILDGG